MPEAPRSWWTARPVLIGGAVVAVGLVAGGVWMATRGDGLDSGPTGANALSRDEESQRRALNIVNEARGMGAVQDFQIIVDLTVRTEEGDVSIYDALLEVLRQNAGEKVVIDDPNIHTSFHRTWASAPSIQGEVVTPDGEVLSTVSIDFGLLGLTEFAIQVLRRGHAESADLLALDLSRDLDEPGSEMLVMVATADYRKKRVHVAPGDFARIAWPDMPGVEAGAVLVPTILFGQTLPGDPVVELALSAHDIFAYRWGLGLTQLLEGDDGGLSLSMGTGSEVVTGSVSSKWEASTLLYNPDRIRPQLHAVQGVAPGTLTTNWTVKPLALDAWASEFHHEQWDRYGMTAKGDILSLSNVNSEQDYERASAQCGELMRRYKNPTDEDIDAYVDLDPSGPRQEDFYNYFWDDVFGTFERAWNLPRIDWARQTGEPASFVESEGGCELFSLPAILEHLDKTFKEACSKRFREMMKANEPLADQDVGFARWTQSTVCDQKPRSWSTFRRGVSRNSRDGRVFGDPHMRTLDGRLYDNMAVGEFLLFDNGTARIQMRTAVGMEGVGLEFSEVVAVAVKAGNSNVMFHRPGLGMQMLVDGEIVEMETGETAMIDGVAIFESYSGWVVVWPDGTVVTIDGVGPRGGLSLSVVSTEPGSVGLLGDGDGDDLNDFVTRSGQQLSPDADLDFLSFYADYIGSWRIAQGESLFHYGPGQSTSTFTLEGYPTRPYGLEDLDADQVAAAAETCQNAGVSTEQVLRWCMFDVAATGDPGYALVALDNDILERSGDRTDPDLDFAVDCPVDNPDGPTWARVVIGDDCYVFDSGSQPWQWCSVAEFGDYMGGEYALDIEGNPVFDFLDFQNRPYVLSLQFGIFDPSATGSPVQDTKVHIGIINSPTYVSQWEHDNWYTGINFSGSDVPEARFIEYSFDPIAGRAVGRAIFTDGITSFGPPDHNPRDPTLVEGSFEIVCNRG